MNGIGDEEATAKHQRTFLEQDRKICLLKDGGVKSAE